MRPEVLVLYRKHSGATELRDEGMFTAGVFLIQRLEGSRFGGATLWVLNGAAVGGGSRAEEWIARSHLIQSSRQNDSESESDEASDAGTPVAVRLR